MQVLHEASTRHLPLRALFLAVAFFAVGLAPGCGTNKERYAAFHRELAAKQQQDELQRQAAVQAEARRLSERQSAMKQSAEARIASGETSPVKGGDPGHPMMNCLDMQPVPFQISADSFSSVDPASAVKYLFPVVIGNSSVICANSVEGSKVLAYREWYCNGKQADCVLSTWSGAQPTFRRPPQNDLRVDLSTTLKGATEPSVRTKLALDRVYS
jgi:hypothetical protein